MSRNLGPRPEDRAIAINDGVIDQIFGNGSYTVGYEPLSWKRYGVLRLLVPEDPEIAYIKTRSVEGMDNYYGQVWRATDKIMVMLQRNGQMGLRRQFILVQRPRDPNLIFTITPNEAELKIQVGDISEAELYHRLYIGLNAVRLFGLPVE